MGFPGQAGSDPQWVGSWQGAGCEDFHKLP